MSERMGDSPVKEEKKGPDQGQRLQDRPRKKGERLPGRRGFKVDELSEQARALVLEMMHKGVPYEKISIMVAEAYGESISGPAICRYNRFSKEQFDLAADRTKKIREWSRAIVGAASENPDVDTGKLLTSLMEGDLLSYITSVDTQSQMADLPINKITDMIYKMSRVSVQRESLLWKAKVQNALKALDEKAQKAQTAQTEQMNESGPADETLKSRLSQIQLEYSLENLRAGLYELGIVDKPKHTKGLDPETLRTIKEEIYGLI